MYILYWSAICIFPVTKLSLPTTMLPNNYVTFFMVTRYQISLKRYPRLPVCIRDSWIVSIERVYLLYEISCSRYVNKLYLNFILPSPNYNLPNCTVIKLCYKSLPNCTVFIFHKTMQKVKFIHIDLQLFLTKHRHRDFFIHPAISS